MQAQNKELQINRDVQFRQMASLKAERDREYTALEDRCTRAERDRADYVTNCVSFDKQRIDIISELQAKLQAAQIELEAARRYIGDFTDKLTQETAPGNVRGLRASWTDLGISRLLTRESLPDW